VGMIIASRLNKVFSFLFRGLGGGEERGKCIEIGVLFPNFSRLGLFVVDHAFAG